MLGSLFDVPPKLQWLISCSIMQRFTCCLCLLALALCAAAAAPELLDDRFELPPGFHIYRAASPELSGGSYDLCFDGMGRLLVGDGNAVRRLIDKDNDGVFDSFEVIATGLGWRGPQGLLVYGDRLYAVGGDGIQLFEGYLSGGPLVHRGRIGNKFNTGGDHEAHTILRGHDGYLYFIAGDGGGSKDRLHITEESSPVLFARAASVFRISPDGKKWECVSAGGRNPPNLGMNYLGELFSFDSDMEWHVGLPWWRPVRLNHWALGGDQGWQEVGAYPPHYIDCLPGILDVGRGSPTWGVFYEHTQFPEKYHDAFLVCDYRWKRESNDQYATTGRLVAFFLKRDGAGWKASMEELARPRAGARDATDKPINFALVDVDVAPDGSLYLSDHNQGIWRLSFGPTKNVTVTARAELNAPHAEVLERLLSLPQPDAAWNNTLQELLWSHLGVYARKLLQSVATDAKTSPPKRLRAVRLLAPDFNGLPVEFLETLAKDINPDIRGQAAWLLGIRARHDEVSILLRLLNDPEPFVRRRAAEAFTRVHVAEANGALIDHMGDPVRLVRYVAMNALAHRPTSRWFEKAVSESNPQIPMRALVASRIRRDVPDEPALRRVIRSLVDAKSLSPEDRLDLLRVLSLFQKSIEGDPVLRAGVTAHLLASFPDPDRDIRWEQVRLLGDYRVAPAFSRLLSLLESERDEVTQFHIAQAIAKLPEGWTEAEEQRLLRWFLGTQRGWFAEFAGKGVEFPHFWSTVLAKFGAQHRAALLRDLSAIEFGGLLGEVALDRLVSSPDAAKTLLQLYSINPKPEAKVRIVRALKSVPADEVSAFLRHEYDRVTNAPLRAVILQGLAGQPPHKNNLLLLQEGLRHANSDVVNTCAAGLLGYQVELTEDLARLLLSRLRERREMLASLEKLLAHLSQTQRPRSVSSSDNKRAAEEQTRAAALEFWTQWFETRFQKKFEPLPALTAVEKSDEEVHRFLLTESARGEKALLGGRVYETLQCHTCHGGGVTPGREGRIFGPDLAGVTRRLSRQDLADAFVYPSKQVADRFKGYEVELDDSTAVTGFITEQDEQSITLVDREQVRRIPRHKVRSSKPQSVSLMPAQLLNRLSWEEIRDLLAFLDEGVPPGSK